VTEVGARQATHWVRLAVDSALFLGLLLTAVGTTNPPAASRPPAAFAIAYPPDTTPGTGFTIDPPSFWMQTGTSVTFQVLWTVDSPLCIAVPLWYWWSLGAGTATGFLNETGGSSALFTADSFSSGSVTVEARSVATLKCGVNETVLEQSAAAEVTIVVPLTVTGVELGPDLLLPGENATFNGTVLGGEPPYTLDLAWGDGTHTIVTQAGPGPFTINHTFSAGEYVPYLLSSDSAGDLVNRSVPEAVSVGTGFQVAVIPTSYVAEVGVPVEFLGEVRDAPSGEVALADCTDGVVGPPVSPPGPNATGFSCTFSSPGTAVVLFGEYPSQIGGASASAVLYETVVLPPEISVEPVVATGEAGSFATLEISLSGGDLPVSFDWNLTGNRSYGSAVVYSDGGGTLALPLVAPGTFAFDLRAIDALGGVGANDSVRVLTESHLEAHADPARSLAPTGVLALVTGSVVSGCPPFSWWVVPDFAPGNGTVENGSVGSVGEFSWNGSYAREGSLSVNVGVADACGSAWRTALSISLVPLLSAEFTAVPGPSSPNETIEINVSIQGGWPPFQLYVNASDSESWNQTLPSAGRDQCLLLTHGVGSLSLEVSVTDQLGSSSETQLTVMLPLSNPTRSSPPPPGNSSAPGGSASVPAIEMVGLLASFVVPAGVATAVGLAWHHRSRRGRDRPTGPDPEETLKRIIEPAEGAERFTVELLAEEAGISLAVVRSTIDRLVSAGRIHSESGADGEEVLSWSTESGQ